MSKFAIGTQAERIADGRRSAAVVAAPAAVDESSGYAVETDGYGERPPFNGAKLIFTLARWGAA